MNDIISDISQAYVEQSAGIEQINLAVGRLDQMTRQQDALAVQAPCLKQLIDNVTR
jgi:methyl-accepting chemotaxis protein